MSVVGLSRKSEVAWIGRVVVLFPPAFREISQRIFFFFFFFDPKLPEIEFPSLYMDTKEKKEL